RRGVANQCGRGLLCFVVGTGHGDERQGAGISPGPVGGGRGEAPVLGRLPEGQAAEAAQLDEPGLERIVAREPLQGFVQGQDLLRRPAGAEGIEVGVHATPAAAVLDASLAAGVLGRDPAHRLSRRGGEGAAIVPAGVAGARGLGRPSPPTSRTYASWTRAVASRVWPGFSWASFRAASSRSSS